MKSALASPSRRNLLSTANVYLAIASAFSPAEYLTSGSLVKRPIKITLFILLTSLTILRERALNGAF